MQTPNGPEDEVMYIRRLVLGVALGVAVAAVAIGGVSAQPDRTADEQLLQKAQIGTNGPALLAYFRQRTVGEAERMRLEGLIRQLGDPAYAVRERAQAELIACGLPAVGPLRQARNDPDVEIARRAERCLEHIEKNVPSTDLSAAAARLLAQRKPAGAVEVLLAYLPLADDETVADEVREALAAVALTDGQPDPLLEETLKDPVPIKRAAAAETLVRTGRPEAIEASRKALADGNPDVRLRTALALVTHAKDRKSVPELIHLLAELPQTIGWRVEEVLLRMAGEEAPQVALGNDDAARQRCRDAWLGWWEQNGAKVDLAKLDATPAMLGYTLVVLRDPRNPNAGQVVELNANKEEVWKITGLRTPADAVVTGKDRVLVIEQSNQLVSERDFTGRVIWSKQVMLASTVQRLPNGNTFITCRNQLVELDPQQKEVFTYQRNQADIVAAQKLRSGEMVFATQNGTCVRLDAQGKEVKTFLTGRTPLYTYGGLEVLNDGRILMTQRTAVAEIDANGQPVWQAPFNLPISVQRLPNGNTLVAGISAQQVAELDRNGKTVWDYKPDAGLQPWRARRR